MDNKFDFSKVSSSLASMNTERLERIKKWKKQQEEERKRGEEARKEWEKKYKRKNV